MPTPRDYQELDAVRPPRVADKRIIASYGNATWTIPACNGLTFMERLNLLDDEIFRMIKVLEARDERV